MNVPEMFGSMVFNDHVMREMLPKKVYQSLQNTMIEGTALDEEVADIVASAMKEWAVSKGATHFTHWFQPMTGITAEKHDSFLTVDKNGCVIMDFSGKELTKGEPDASSFPSGGLRATFEARGYTAWDPTSYAFIKDDTLCIPTAFCSYTGQILDKKTPLLRSMDAISAEAVRALALFGKHVRRVNATIGAEQEYFLIDKNDYSKRLDLRLTGRTLIGAPAAKGQEMEDHYFGSIRPRVKAFMADLDEELWKLGITAKTEHNEVAPCQHEMAPIFLLHEKPFEGINGSGKHNNWALSTDEGENLLDPGKTPKDNAQFLLFLTAVIKAVDEYQDLLRISVASAGNDHRLGANEAPPAIVSIFVGDELDSVISSIIEDRPFHGRSSSQHLDIGTSVLPKLARDNSDRNRTSPFAFTGNKFEFRMPGSSFNIACTNVMLNTAVADSLKAFCDELEGAPDFNTALNVLIKRELEKHRRILFNGNGYSKEWEKEAEKRGLSNYKRTPDALVHYCDEKNVELFRRHKVYTKEEMESRLEISLDEYQKAIHIEAVTMIEMLRRQILPAALRFTSSLASSIEVKERIGVAANADKALCARLNTLCDGLLLKTDELDECVAASPAKTEKAAFYAADRIIPAMEEARKLSDSIEALTDKSCWPVPTYSDILFYV